MVTNKWCNKNLNASPISWSYVLGELKELVEARTWSDIKEEFSDVMYGTLCAIHASLHIVLPMIGAASTINKVKKRLLIWEDIFEKNNLDFHIKYLVNGSNYHKQNKLDKALELAKSDQEQTK